MSTKDTDTFISIPGRFEGSNEVVLVDATVYDEDEPWTLHVIITGEGIILDIVNPSDGEVVSTKGQTFQEIADEMVLDGF